MSLRFRFVMLNLFDKGNVRTEGDDCDPVLTRRSRSAASVQTCIVGQKVSWGFHSNRKTIYCYSEFVLLFFPKSLIVWKMFLVTFTNSLFPKNYPLPILAKVQCMRCNTHLLRLNIRLKPLCVHFQR